MTHADHPFLIGKKRARFEAIQECLVPRSKQFTPEQKLRAQELVNGFLQTKSPAVRFKLAAFLILIDLVSLAVGFKTFKRLREDQQHQVMDRFFDSSMGVFRKGFWGINTLAKMGVYGQPSVYEEIGYRLRETPR